VRASQSAKPRAALIATAPHLDTSTVCFAMCCLQAPQQ
jgi:hypothetical protein